MSLPEFEVHGDGVPLYELDRLRAENERLRAELATARKDALGEAALECNALAHRGNGTVGARNCFEIQRAICALAQKEKP